jgi:hypothetical protein
LVGDGTVRLMLTALFLVLGTWYLASAAIALWNGGSGRGARALGAALHVLMSGAVISTFWSWGADVPVIAQVTLFTAAAGWFVGQAVFGAGGHHGDGSYGNWYHAGMMTVMVWMAVAIAAMPSSSTDSGMSGMSMPGGDMGGMDMAGMDMGGQVSAGATGAVSGIPMTGSPGWAETVCLVLAVALFAAAAWQAFAALRPLAAPDQGPAPGLPWHDITGTVLRDGVGALMAAGMAVALLLMA